MREGRPPLSCIDLFCGCGGFSLGMRRAGFSVPITKDCRTTAKRNTPSRRWMISGEATQAALKSITW